MGYRADRHRTRAPINIRTVVRRAILTPQYRATSIAYRADRRATHVPNNSRVHVPVQLEAATGAAMNAIAQTLGNCRPAPGTVLASSVRRDPFHPQTGVFGLVCKHLHCHPPGLFGDSFVRSRIGGHTVVVRPPGHAGNPHSSTVQEPSLRHRRPRFGCLAGTFSPSRRHRRSTRLSLTCQPASRSRAAIRR